MKIISYSMLIVVWFVAIYFAVTSAPMEGRKIDCGVAEFHPDYTTEMKNACREQRRIKT